MGRKRTKSNQISVVGINCRRLRSERNWTQAELALAAKVSPGTIAKLELGMNQSVDLATIQSLARAFDVPMAQLITEQSITNGTVGVRPFLEAFYRSGYAQEMIPTRAEKAWLESLAPSVWSEREPDGETIATLLRWHRRK